MREGFEFKTTLSREFQEKLSAAQLCVKSATRASCTAASWIGNGGAVGSELR